MKKFNKKSFEFGKNFKIFPKSLLIYFSIFSLDSIFETYTNKKILSFNRIQIITFPNILKFHFNSDFYESSYIIATLSEYKNIEIDKNLNYLSLENIYYEKDDKSLPVLIYNKKQKESVKLNDINSNILNRDENDKILKKRKLSIKSLFSIFIYNDKIKDFKIFIFLRILSNKRETIRNNLCFYKLKRCLKTQNYQISSSELIGYVMFESDFSNFILFILIGKKIILTKFLILENIKFIIK